MTRPGAVFDRCTRMMGMRMKFHEQLDELHRRLLTVIEDPAWTGTIPAAVDVTLLGRFYERFGDHAVVVGRRVIFLVTGEQMTP